MLLLSFSLAANIFLFKKWKNLRMLFLESVLTIEFQEASTSNASVIYYHLIEGILKKNMQF
jgi:hypothetical protein